MPKLQTCLKLRSRSAHLLSHTGVSLLSVSSAQVRNPLIWSVQPTQSGHMDRFNRVRFLILCDHCLQELGSIHFRAVRHIYYFWLKNTIKPKDNKIQTNFVIWKVSHELQVNIIFTMMLMMLIHFCIREVKVNPCDNLPKVSHDIKPKVFPWCQTWCWGQCHLSACLVQLHVLRLCLFEQSKV